MATAAADLLNDNDAGQPASFVMLAQIAQSEGDISGLFDDSDLARIGSQVVRDYERDLASRSTWETKVRKALKRAAQEHDKPTDMPAWRRSHVDYPLLTIAAQQFNARAYPAICRPGEVVQCKVIGNDNGLPQIGQDGQPVMQPTGPAPVGDDGQPSGPPPMGPVWQVAPGAKQERADRVAQYLNVYIEYRMEDWEGDTDLLLMQIPIVGCGFRKLWWQDGKQQSSFVSALDLVVPMSAKSLKTTPRATEQMNDVYPFQIRERMNAGLYRRVELTPLDDDDEAPRLLLEQHRLMDADGDGVDEPYVITVDKETTEVLRIEAAFGIDDVQIDERGAVKAIERPVNYIKYPFLPDPKGGFYDIGFGHLIEQISDVVNASINQLMDAGSAQIAGGGFIASGLRLQSNNRDESIRWAPGEWKTVSATGADLRSGIVDKTLPNVSPITYQVLDMMLGAAKEVTSVKDIVTGDAPNTAPVGTTLALIEQGLQVFTAIYKRTFRAAGAEYSLIYENLGKHGDDGVAQDYAQVLDDPQADFVKDFAETDADIKPVADPSAVTAQQRIAKAQLVNQVAQGNPLIDQKEALTRVFRAAGIDNIDALWAQPTGPNPADVADLALKQSQTALNNARATQASATATKVGVDVGHKLGEAESGNGGGLPGMAVPADDTVGDGGLGGTGGSPAGDVGAGVVGAGSI